MWKTPRGRGRGKPRYVPEQLMIVSPPQSSVNQKAPMRPLQPVSIRKRSAVDQLVCSPQRSYSINQEFNHGTPVHMKIEQKYVENHESKIAVNANFLHENESIVDYNANYDGIEEDVNVDDITEEIDAENVINNIGLMRSHNIEEQLERCIYFGMFDALEAAKLLLNYEQQVGDSTRVFENFLSKNHRNVMNLVKPHLDGIDPSSHLTIMYSYVSNAVTLQKQSEMQKEFYIMNKTKNIHSDTFSVDFVVPKLEQNFECLSQLPDPFKMSPNVLEKFDQEPADLWVMIRRFMTFFFSNITDDICDMKHYTLRLSNTAITNKLVDIPWKVIEILKELIVKIFDLKSPELIKNAMSRESIMRSSYYQAFSESNRCDDDEAKQFLLFSKLQVFVSQYINFGYKKYVAVVLKQLRRKVADHEPKQPSATDQNEQVTSKTSYSVATKE